MLLRVLLLNFGGPEKLNIYLKYLSYGHLWFFYFMIGFLEVMVGKGSSTCQKLLVTLRLLPCKGRRNWQHLRKGLERHRRLWFLT